MEKRRSRHLLSYIRKWFFWQCLKPSAFARVQRQQPGGGIIISRQPTCSFWIWGRLLSTGWEAFEAGITLFVVALVRPLVECFHLRPKFSKLTGAPNLLTTSDNFNSAPGCFCLGFICAHAADIKLVENFLDFIPQCGIGWVMITDDPVATTIGLQLWTCQ